MTSLEIERTEIDVAVFSDTYDGVFAIEDGYVS